MTERNPPHGSIPVPDSAGYVRLGREILYREWLLFVRYPANAIGGIVMSLLFFLLIFFGGRLVAGQAFSDSLGGIVVGYFLWTLAVGAYSSISNDITNEAQWGTLERHLMTPFGFGPVALFKGVAKILRTFVTSLIVLGVMLFLTHPHLELPLLTIGVVTTLSIASVLGLGFAAGGLTVLYKRIGTWLSLLQFGFIALISTPVRVYPWTKVLPLTLGSSLLQRTMIDGTRLWEFGLVNLGLLAAVAVGYLAGGYLVFHLTTRRARRLGVVGDY